MTMPRIPPGGGGANSNTNNEIDAIGIINLADSGEWDTLIAILQDPETVGDGSGSIDPDSTNLITFDPADIGLPDGGTVTLTISGDIDYDETAEASEDGMVYFLIPVMKVGSEITVSITVKDSTDKIVRSGSKEQTVTNGCSIAVTLTGEVFMKPGPNIKTALVALGAKTTPLKTFASSPTPPADGVATQKLSTDDSPTEVLAWCEGTSIKYYAAGYTDTGTKIPLNANSSSMFENCEKLSSIDVSGFDTSNVTRMDYMFSIYNSNPLTSITGLNGFDTSKVTNMCGMFWGLRNLTGLDLSSFDTSNVTSMECMFYECNGLTSLDLSSFNTGKVETMRYMFYGCNSLVTIYASAGFTTANVTESSSMFSGCTSLQGGAGTTFVSSPTDKTYARIDGDGGPGYFTAR